MMKQEEIAAFAVLEGAGARFCWQGGLRLSVSPDCRAVARAALAAVRPLVESCATLLEDGWMTPAEVREEHELADWYCGLDRAGRLRVCRRWERLVDEELPYLQARTRAMREARAEA